MPTHESRMFALAEQTMQAIRFMRFFEGREARRNMAAESADVVFTAAQLRR